MVRGNQLFSTLDCGAMQPADQSVIIVVDVLNAEKLGTFPGDMDALEVLLLDQALSVVQLSVVHYTHRDSLRRVIKYVFLVFL